MSNENPKVEATFTLVALPDTQIYSQLYPSTYVAQTKWIFDHWDEEDFDFVVHLGDIVNNYENEWEWKNAALAMSLLNPHPWTVLPGNHDLPYMASASPYLDKYFPPKDNLTFPEGTIYNNYQIIGDYLIMSIGFMWPGNSPSPSLKWWIDSVLSNHQDKQVIVVTHHFLNPKGELDSWSRPLWDVLREHPNIFLILAGHSVVVGSYERQEMTLKLTGIRGNQVWAITSNYQTYLGENSGYFRIYRIYDRTPDRFIKVETFSPLRGYLREKSSEFFVDAERIAPS